MNSHAIKAARWLLVELQTKRLDLIIQGATKNNLELKRIEKSIKGIEAAIDYCEPAN